MKFQLIYCVQVLWINLYIQHCWNQTVSRINCQHNLSKGPAQYLTSTRSTRDQNNQTFGRSKFILYVWNGITSLQTKLVVKFVSAAWFQFENTIYTQHYTVNHGKVDPIWSPSATRYAYRPYITKFIYSVLHFPSTPAYTKNMVSDSLPCPCLCCPQTICWISTNFVYTGCGIKNNPLTYWLAYRINMTSLMMSYDNNKHKYFTAGIRSNLNNISNG